MVRLLEVVPAAGDRLQVAALLDTCRERALKPRDLGIEPIPAVEDGLGLPD
jgi:hypothetical protein